MAADDSSDDELFLSLARAGGEQVQSGFIESSPPSLWSSSDDDDAMGGEGHVSRRAKPKIVGSFIIGDKIGEGAYAVVREAINRDTLKIVAAKVVDLRRLRKMRGGVENIRREVRVQKALKRHPNLVELVHAEEDPAKKKAYLFMEISNGCTLQHLIELAPQKRIPESQAAHLVFQTLTGLLYMHRRGIVHRDVKPGNLLVNADGVLKIVDFGVAEFLDAYAVEDNVTRTSGSPAFQAPEIANGEIEYSGMKVDVWAVGVTAYNILTGDVPFNALNVVELFRLISLGQYRPIEGVSDSARDAVGKMLRMNWHDRFSVEDMLKHPWIVRGERSLTNSERDAFGWVNIPRKKFSILEHVQRLLDGGQGAEIHVVSRRPGSSTRGGSSGQRNLTDVFRPSGDVGVGSRANDRPSDIVGRQEVRDTSLPSARSEGVAEQGDQAPARRASRVQGSLSRAVSALPRVGDAAGPQPLQGVGSSAGPAQAREAGVPASISGALLELQAVEAVSSSSTTLPGASAQPGTAEVDSSLQSSGVDPGAAVGDIGTLFERPGVEPVSSSSTELGGAPTQPETAKIDASLRPSGVDFGDVGSPPMSTRDPVDTALKALNIEPLQAGETGTSSRMVASKPGVLKSSATRELYRDQGASPSHSPAACALTTVGSNERTDVQPEAVSSGAHMKPSDFQDAVGSSESLRQFSEGSEETEGTLDGRRMCVIV